MKLAPARPYFFGIEDKLARRSDFAAMHLARFLEALDQFVKEFLFHLTPHLRELAADP